MASSRNDRIGISTSRNGLYVHLESESSASHPSHPLLGRQHEEATERSFSGLVDRLSISMASESSKVMPVDDKIKTFPSGIQVQATFLPMKDATLLLDEFQALLSDLSESRTLPGPFGRSLTQHRLHRHVECNKVTFMCTAHIPIEGAHTIASTESFRSFLSSVALFSMATPSAWSAWWLGNTAQSLDEARAVMTATPETYAANYRYASRIRPVRPARWMQWTRDCSSTHDHEDSTSTNACQYSMVQGMQYELLVYHEDLRSFAIPLAALFPANAGTSSTLTVDPFADATYIAMDQRFTLQSSADNKLALHREEATETNLYSIAASTLDLNDATLVLQNSLLRTDTPSCSIHSRLLRDQGQGNTGTFELYVENLCQDNSCTSVSIEQSLPCFMAPQWRSLQLLLNERTIAFRDLGPSSHIHFHEDGSSRIVIHQITNATSLRLLLDYDPVFLSVDSFPGDANRGLELPPAKAIFHCRPDTVLYTDPQLILSPLPDMSMPFNVISLTCTFYAFIVGSILNLAIRKASKHVKDQLDPENAEPDSVLGKVRAKVVKVVRVIVGKIWRVQPQ